MRRHGSTRVTMLALGEDGAGTGFRWDWTHVTNEQWNPSRSLRPRWHDNGPLLRKVYIPALYTLCVHAPTLSIMKCSDRRGGVALRSDSKASEPPPMGVAR